MLHAMGARSIEVDTSAWLPDRVGLDTKRRPDTALRQQRAHEAATHDVWFREEVSKSLQEADGSDADWVANNDVKREGAAHRATWLSRIEGGRKSV
jgi:hypothetical protein